MENSRREGIDLIYDGENVKHSNTVIGTLRELKRWFEFSS